MEPLTGFNKVARIVRSASPVHDNIVGFPHYFPLSFMPADFWPAVMANPAIRVTNAGGKQLPIHVIDLDPVYEKGSLWFRAGKNSGPRVFYVHYESDDAEVQLTGPYGTQAVWSSFADVVHFNEGSSDLGESYAANSVNGNLGLINGTPFNMWNIDSLLEQRANRFINAFGSNNVEFGAGTFDTFTSPRTWLFLLKVHDGVQTKKTLFQNANDDLEEMSPFKMNFRWGPNPGTTYVGLDIGQGDGVGAYTGEGAMDDLVSDEWYVFAIRYTLGAGGVQVDVNKVARVMEAGQDVGVWPTHQNAAIRTVGGSFPSDLHNVTVSALLAYDGDLAKAQRDVFFDNWMTPAEFWTVEEVEVVEDKKNICLSSHIEKDACFASNLKK